MVQGRSRVIASVSKQVLWVLEGFLYVREVHKRQCRTSRSSRNGLATGVCLSPIATGGGCHEYTAMLCGRVIECRAGVVGLQPLFDELTLLDGLGKIEFAASLSSVM